MSDPHALIVGGGISGLSAAFYACRKGLRTTLIEGSHRLGGLIRTDAVNGCTLEAGPDSFLAAKPAVAQLAQDLGLSGALIDSNDAERRIFVARNGELVPMPRGMVMMVPTDLEAVNSSPLFNEKTRQQVQAELSMPPVERQGDFSLGELVQSHFGEEALAYIAEPLLSGVYGGDPARLSARSVLPRFVEYERTFGSLIRGARQEVRAASTGSLFRSFAGGMGQLVLALEAEVRKHATIHHDKAVSVEQTPGGTYCIHCAGTHLEATQVILATPAYEAAKLLATLDTGLANEVDQIPYSSAVLGTFLFDRKSFSHPIDGFGFLVPGPERQTIAAATWINTKFPSRVTGDLVAIRAFTVDPEAQSWMQKPDVEISAAMWNDLRRWMGPLACPLYAGIHRWPRSMPQYVVGHAERVRQIAARLSQWPGLSLVSNYLEGVGIPDCVRLAAAASG